MNSVWLGRGIVSFMTFALYAPACALPAIHLDEGGHACTAIRMGSPPGIVVLLLGWVPPYCIPWSANLLLLGGWIFLLVRRYRTAAILGGSASLVAVTTWAFAFPSLLAGYFLWQASLVAFAAGASVLAVTNRTSDQSLGSSRSG